MANSDYIEVEADVIMALPNALFKVKLDNGCEIIAYISGKIRQHAINIIPGDRVKVQLSKYDLTKGRITYRIKR